MDVCEEWWHSLPAHHRRYAKTVTSEIPDWMVTSLQAANVPIVAAEMAEHDGSHRMAFLLPTYLVDFIAAQT